MPADWSKVKELGIAGQSDDYIADVLSSTTRYDIPTSKLRQWLRDQLLWFVGVKGPSGAMQTAYDHANTPAEVQAGLDLFYAAVFGDSANVVATATMPAIAVQVRTIILALLDIGVINVEQMDLFYGLGGGLISSVLVNASDVAAARAANDAAVASEAAKAANAPTIAAAWNQHVAPVAEDVSLVVGGGLSDLAAFKAALSAMAASL